MERRSRRERPSGWRPPPTPARPCATPRRRLSARYSSHSTCRSPTTRPRAALNSRRPSRRPSAKAFEERESPQAEGLGMFNRPDMCSRYDHDNRESAPGSVIASRSTPAVLLGTALDDRRRARLHGISGSLGRAERDALVLVHWESRNRQVTRARIRWRILDQPCCRRHRAPAGSSNAEGGALRAASAPRG